MTHGATATPAASDSPGTARRAPDAAPFERHIPLESAVNFRDLGGYRTADGRTVRWRSLFRADSLSQLTQADRAVVRSLGVATVIDLRSLAEVDLARFPVDELPVGFHHLPLVGKLPAFETFRQGAGFFAGHYQEMARDSADQIAAAIAIVAQRYRHPVVVHCAAGKDRTGVLIGIVLALLDVPDETIVEDYALSNRAMEALLARVLDSVPDQREIILEVAPAMLSATPANIAAMLDGLRAAHGSIEGYAAAHGAGPDVVASLRAALLE
ncbi:MAG: tyrosine-protein phosphatase [Acidimicrobiales bacterium]